ncbi:hypothetical protein MIMGU_mgv1a025185mg [Erythranthe guttata]|uniref:Transcription factor TFIIB cyclin-like domain-containing protein n=1 Tax=Erythranthe guttata TaxID=4155 RepID=A0A022QNN6_ERYGU|nr:hypothetical protein MIMGU_mgv1a025185mg [Erythranthe guttata]
MACSSCGVVQEFDNFKAHIGRITGETGTYIHIGKSGAGSVNTYKENKIYEAEKVIEDLVKSLIEKLTAAEYGQGKWFPVFVGACAYAVMRRDRRILPIVQVAESVCCDAYELGRMISRVVDFIDLKLPEFDIVYAFESAIKRCPSFGNCLIKWFVTTGRQPMPVVAAVLVFVAELNEVHVKIDDVANELHVAVSTCRRRYKELMESRSVIQYMEMKSMEKCSRGKSQIQSVDLFLYDLERLVGDCLRKDGYDSLTREEDCSTSYSNQSIDYPDKFQISHESLSVIYSDFAERREKKVQLDIDWEDLIMETLLLHNVKEEEIENGHYNALMALHVFDDCMD